MSPVTRSVTGLVEMLPPRGWVPRPLLVHQPTALLVWGRQLWGTGARCLAPALVYRTASSWVLLMAPLASRAVSDKCPRVSFVS